MRKRLLCLSIGLSLCLWLVAHAVKATTLEGATTRNVSIDGQIGPLAANGSNGSEWEQNEYFQGFQGTLGSLDWYLTWDDNNLYLARRTGNNAEPSLLYLRVDYPGASFSNFANNVGYDGFNPSFGNMGGINFVAYMKQGYDEYRLFQGSNWTGAATNLNPVYGSSGGAAVMEVAIPWSFITGGGPKPTNIRAVMYQLAPDGCGAGQPFPYGESPWGTGVGTDGPSVGVSDGNATSAAQPGGCGNLNSDITRWWGCYPVIGGVSSNGFEAVAPNAGADAETCDPIYQLQGNDPAANAIGTWTVISKPADVPNPTFDNANDPRTTVRGLLVNTGSAATYVFGWSINYGACPAPPDQVTITRYATPSDANAGANTQLGCEVSSFVLQGNAPAIGTGTWSVISGTGTFADANDPNTTVSGLGYGVNVLQWSIANGPCTPSSAQVSLTRYATPVAVANAFDTLRLCETETGVVMSANNPADIPGIASGQWALVSGPSGFSFANETAYNTGISWTQPGNYTLRWTVTSGTCGSISDDLLVEVYETPTATAGSDVEVCVNAVGGLSLLGNDPAAFVGNPKGYWTQEILEGSARLQFADSTKFDANASWTQPGRYRLTWHMQNGPCAEASDTKLVTIYAIPTAEAGDPIVGCQATGPQPLNANNPSVIQSSAVGFWTQNSGPGTLTFSNINLHNTDIFWNAVGTYSLTWTVSNGACGSISDVVLASVGQTAVASAGDDQRVCFTATTATLLGNDPTPFNASGEWSKVSGPGNLVFDVANSRNATVRWDQAGTYEIGWRVVNTCANVIDVMVLTVDAVPSVANAGTNAVACATDGNLNAIAPNPGTGTWASLGAAIVASPNDPKSAVSGLVPGSNSFRWTVANGACPSTSSTVTLNYTPPPAISVAVTDNKCAGASAGELLITATSNAATFTYSINGGAYQASNRFAALPSGNYAVSVRSNGGCIYERSATIDEPDAMSGLAVATFNKASKPNVADGSFSITPPAGGVAPYTYSIDGTNFSTATSFNGLLARSYTIIAKDANECTISIAFELPHRLLPEIFNAFSPNGDGTNDVWNLPFLADYPDAIVRILNIWGEELFSSEGTYTAWDGEYKGKPVPDGTYYYWIDLKDGGEPYKGSLTLIR